MRDEYGVMHRLRVIAEPETRGREVRSDGGPEAGKLPTGITVTRPALNYPERATGARWKVFDSGKAP